MKSAHLAKACQEMGLKETPSKKKIIKIIMQKNNKHHFFN